MSKEHETQGLSRDARGGVALHGVPATPEHGAVLERDFAEEVEREAEGMRRHVFGAVAGAVRDCDAAFAEGGEVHVIGADGHACDELHAGGFHARRALGVDGHELADDGFHAVKLLGGGGAVGRVNATDEVDGVGVGLLGKDLVSKVEVFGEGVVEDSMPGHSVPFVAKRCGISQYLSILGALSFCPRSRLD